MDYAALTREAIEAEGIEKISRKSKESFLKQYYFCQQYEFMSHKEVIEVLKSDGIIEPE